MPENDQNLGWNVNIADLSSLAVDGDSLENLVTDESVDINDVAWTTPEASLDPSTLDSAILDQWGNTINENVFLDAWEDNNIKTKTSDSWDNLWKYLRTIFFAWLLIFLWVLVIVFAHSFSRYMEQASKITPDAKYQEFVTKYKEGLQKAKQLAKIDYVSKYETPKLWMNQPLNAVNNIINATDLDYIEKKDLLSNYVSNLVKDAQDKVVYVEALKEKIAKQWFLPSELESLLSDEQAIDTIQRSLNALEVVKFSTATKVFSYMNTALVTISEMIRLNSVSVETLKQLFDQINWRWEKDITSYVYMCYLNPFETDANCDTVWDLDLYYSILKDDSFNIKLFKNAMNAISQLLEKWDSTLFSITFNGFNAQQKNISFNIEVYTNQEDERILLTQWQRNPNIFILTNIINLLKQSSFIIWADISTKEINVDTRTISRWNISKTVNYSSMDFTVPIQKNTEREIFDYIDFESLKKLLKYKLSDTDSLEDKANESEIES